MAIFLFLSVKYNLNILKNNVCLYYNNWENIMLIRVEFYLFLSNIFKIMFILIYQYLSLFFNSLLFFLKSNVLR